MQLKTFILRFTVNNQVKQNFQYPSVQLVGKLTH